MKRNYTSQMMVSRPTISRNRNKSMQEHKVPDSSTVSNTLTRVTQLRPHSQASHTINTIRDHQKYVAFQRFKSKNVYSSLDSNSNHSSEKRKRITAKHIGHVTSKDSSYFSTLRPVSQSPYAQAFHFVN